MPEELSSHELPSLPDQPSGSLSSIQILEQEKLRLGTLEILDLEADTFPLAHEQLGKRIKEQVHKSIDHKLSGLPSYPEFQAQIHYVRDCLSKIRSKATDPQVDSQIRAVVLEYLDCLTQWGQGAEISQIDHPFIKKLRDSIEPEYNPDLLIALWLQNDNQGCQTGMLRSPDGSVKFWHTEEDVEETPGDRFDKIHLAKFSIGQPDSKKTIYSIIYPDLLPGAGFSFGKDFIYAVDFQHIPSTDQPGFLANAGVWIAWRLGADYDPAQVIRSLTPYADGYTLNTVRQVTGDQGVQLEAKKIEFGRRLVQEFALADDPGANFISVNIFDPKGELARKIEAIEEEDKSWYQRRLKRAQRALHLIPLFTQRNIQLPELLRMIGFKVGGVTDAAYANVDVKAHVVASFSLKENAILVDSGPAIKAEQPMKFEFTL